MGATQHCREQNKIFALTAKVVGEVYWVQHNIVGARQNKIFALTAKVNVAVPLPPIDLTENDCKLENWRLT